MNTFTNLMTEFLIMRKQDVISVLFKDNAEYTELRQALNNYTSQDIENFKEDIHRLYDIESDYLYLQGFKDCIQLLRFIEAL